LALWGNDPESKRIFKLQKKIIRIISNVGRNASCRNLFRDLNILPLPCLCINEVVCYTKSNIEKMKLNDEIHNHCKRHKSDLHVQFYRTTLFKNNVANMGIKLYNKLPNKVKKLGKLQKFKRKLKYFLLQHIFYSVDKYVLLNIFYHMLITMHVCCHMCRYIISLFCNLYCNLN
jgi:hypothetical protein